MWPTESSASRTTRVRTMRIALATGLLRVPPTYFALQHADYLLGQHDFTMFTLASDVRDPSIQVPVDTVVPSVGPWRMRAGAAFIGRAAASASQARRISRFHPDLVHQHFATWSAGAVDGAARRGAPLVTTLHGYDVFIGAQAGLSPLARFHAAAVRDAAVRSDRLLAVSAYLADAARINGFPSERLHVHHQGVDSDYFTPGGRREIDGPRTLLFVGGLTAQKGVPDLLAASSRLASRAPHRLRLIGTGPLDREARDFAAKHPAIEVLGPLPRHEVRAELRAAHALILPTQAHRGRREAAGLALLEAQACGVPVIAYRSGGTPEMMLDGATGVLVDEFDVDALTRAMERMLRLSDGDRHAMGAAARAFVVDHRSTASSSAVLVDHYRDLVGGS